MAKYRLLRGKHAMRTARTGAKGAKGIQAGMTIYEAGDVVELTDEQYDRLANKFEPTGAAKSAATRKKAAAKKKPPKKAAPPPADD